MSNKPKKPNTDTKKSAFKRIKDYKGITEYKLKNGLTVLYMHMPETGVITTNITYKVGSRDERSGETGLAHMLEHMLFKPTSYDLKRKIDSSAMQFERETGCILNANTWKDRTTYFFSYPKEYFSRALQIEAERMHDVVLTDKEFLPEQGNVLSEFDMYFGDPYFALNFNMVPALFHSHTYGHETIGFREDIERFTCEKLRTFYERFYDPCNATLMVIGDIEEKAALTEVEKHFGALRSNGTVDRNDTIIEPKQEGLRRIVVTRPSQSNIVAFGMLHEGFPDKGWFATSLLSAILTGGPDSILYKKLVDTGLASKVEMSVEPTSEKNAAFLYVTLSKKSTHEGIEKKVFEIIKDLDPKEIALQYKKTQAHILTDEIVGRDTSLKVAMELTEYVSAGVWEKFFDTQEMLKTLTAKDIVAKAQQLFVRDQMTIGHFIGKN